MKEEIDAEMFTMRTTAAKHRNKKEWRTDTCLKIADYERGEIIYRDKKTGQERGCRPMTHEERHIPLIRNAPPGQEMSIQ